MRSPWLQLQCSHLADIGAFLFDLKFASFLGGSGVLLYHQLIYFYARNKRIYKVDQGRRPVP